MGNGAKVATKAISSLPFEDPKGTKGTMTGVHLIPGAPFNLISGTKLLNLGFELTGNKDTGMVYTKGGQKLVFDMKIKSPEGMLLATRLKRTANEVGGAAKTKDNKTKTISIQ